MGVFSVYILCTYYLDSKPLHPAVKKVGLTSDEQHGLVRVQMEPDHGRCPQYGKKRNEHACGYTRTNKGYRTNASITGETNKPLPVDIEQTRD
jgi:hypothetical protein